MSRLFTSMALIFSGFIALAQPGNPAPASAVEFAPLILENPTEEKAVVELRSFDGAVFQRFELAADERWTLNVGQMHGYYVVRIVQPSGTRTRKYFRP